MGTEWFKPRRYKHFDRPVCEAFAEKVMQPDFVERHAFTPLLHYFKKTRRYKKDKGKIEIKERPIMYASHRDACIFSFYSAQLGKILDAFYQKNRLNDNVIAYRALKRANYDFSATAFQYAVAHAPCAILAFDVSGFFDNLDHYLLKTRLKRLLGLTSLPEDWYQILKVITKFHYIKLSELEAHTKFAAALNTPGTGPIATVAELKVAEISFYQNEKATAGIPQGTPISATMSNLYMVDFDLNVRDYCESIGALYRRYSDDILIICPLDKAAEAEAKIGNLISAEKLELSANKTETTFFDPGSTALHSARSAQYLGFSYYPGGAGIRPSSLSRQWRKLRRSLKKTRKVAEAAILSGVAKKVYTKKLRRKFSPLQFRNFSSYARRSAAAFGAGEKITEQVKRIERRFEREVRDLEKINAK